MNSIDRHLNADSKAATLLAMRSARKEILFVVEGDTDVEMFSNALGLPRSNILSCDGKETLMLVYSLAPQKGIDTGAVFIRDRDNDGLSTTTNNDVLLLVTDRYDVEMELLEHRLFGRILSEFIKTSLDKAETAEEFGKLCLAASYIGAIRIHSQQDGLNLDFDDLKYSKFINPKDLSVNLGDAIRYIFAKSKKGLPDKKITENVVSAILATNLAIDIVCSKEFFDILHLALSRHYDACSSGECLPSVLGRILRISIVQDDLKEMSLYSHFKSHVSACEYPWPGFPL